MSIAHSDPKTVLLTGASSGIGRDAAVRLAKAGFRVLAGVRRDPDADALRSCHLDLLQPILLDVTRPDQIEHAASHVAASVGPTGLYALINNAGIATGGPQESIALDQWRLPMEVNVFGTVAVTRAMLPHLRNAVNARIINMSSAYGCVGVPFIAPYCASKHALEALSDGLRTELRPWGIHVCVIAPAEVSTPIWTKAEQNTADILARLTDQQCLMYGETLQRMASRGISAGHRGMPVDRVSNVILRAIRAHRPRARYPVGLNSHILALARRFFPIRMRDWLIRWQAGL